MAYVINDSCVACGTCIDECPVGAISEGDIYSIDPETCTDCGTCADVCPSGSNSPGRIITTLKDKEKPGSITEAGLSHLYTFSYFSSANAALIRRIASTIFSSLVA